MKFENLNVIPFIPQLIRHKNVQFGQLIKCPGHNGTTQINVISRFGHVSKS